MSSNGFDRGAAVTRSLLGWGLVAGPFYVIFGFVLGTTRDGFDFTRHPLSVLTLGELGWLQQTNFILSGLMVLAAAVGFLRAIPGGRGMSIGMPVGIYGLSLILSAVFRPDPVAGFPQLTDTAGDSVSGILHLVAGGVGFLALTTAAIAHAIWRLHNAQRHTGRISLVLGFVIVAGFLGGGALSTATVGITLLWLAVLAGWGWLAFASMLMYSESPHPDRNVTA